MSDVLSDLPRPPHPPSWRDRLAEWAETLDVSPARLVAGGVAVVVVGLLGWKLLDPPPPPPEMRLPFVSTSTPAEAGGGSTTTAAGEQGDGEVVVHVAGAVARPGVQRLPAGSRVIDAVDAAGGPAGDADVGQVNLAARLEDGQQVYVPRVGEQPPPVGPASSPSGGASSSTGGPVDLNRASVAELDALPGIGPTIAQAIVDHRTEHGRFGSVDELLDVRGIGEAKLEELRPLVTV